MAALSLLEQQEAGRMYASGCSASQIASYFNVTLGAAFYALRHQNVARRTPAETNRIRFERAPLSYSIKEKLTLSEERLKLAAVMLYWGEGYKAGKNTVDFANSDPSTAFIFTRFLVEICRVNRTRLRCSLYCHEGQQIAHIKEFWSNLLGIPLTQFIKPYVKRSAPGVRGPRMPYGLVHVRYCDTKLLRQILLWIDEYRAESVGGRAVNCTGL